MEIKLFWKARKMKRRRYINEHLFAPFLSRWHLKDRKNSVWHLARQLNKKLSQSLFKVTGKPLKNVTFYWSKNKKIISFWAKINRFWKKCVIPSKWIFADIKNSLAHMNTLYMPNKFHQNLWHMGSFPCQLT